MWQAATGEISPASYYIIAETILPKVCINQNTTIRITSICILQPLEGYLKCQVILHDNNLIFRGLVLMCCIINFEHISRLHRTKQKKCELCDHLQS